MYCLGKWTQRSWQVPAQQWTWKVTLRPQQREPPPNRTGPTTPRTTTLQLCLFMVGARLMTMLLPGPNTPTQHYPRLTEEDMPGIQRSFFRNLRCHQQSHPHVLELTWTHPSLSPIPPSKTTPQNHHAPHMTRPMAPAPAR